MNLKKFDSKAEKLVKKSDIMFVDFTRNIVTVKGQGRVKFTPVMYRGHMRLAISK